MLENEKKADTKNDLDFGVIVEAAENSCADAVKGPKAVLSIVAAMARAGVYDLAHAKEFNTILGDLIKEHENAKSRLRQLSIKIEAAKIVAR